MEKDFKITFILQHQADREETYIKLMSHREKAKEDKYLLENHEKEHSRLVRLIEKNNKTIQS